MHMNKRSCFHIMCTFSLVCFSIFFARIAILSARLIELLQPSAPLSLFQLHWGDEVERLKPPTLSFFVRTGELKMSPTAYFQCINFSYFGCSWSYVDTGDQSFSGFTATETWRQKGERQQLHLSSNTHSSLSCLNQLYNPDLFRFECQFFVWVLSKSFLLLLFRSSLSTAVFLM